MNELNPSQKLPPDLRVFGNDLKAEIFATLNCVQVGKIEKVTPGEQTVEISLQIKRAAVDGTSTAYPVLVDCPYFVLQGGGAYIDMPISVGDYCLVLFCDRNIDTWWSTANVADPATPRKHSLSDGFALVGLNPKTSPRDMDGEKTRIINSKGIELNGNTKTLVTGAELQSALTASDGMINTELGKIAVLLNTLIPGSYVVTPVVTTITPALTTTVKTGG